MLSCKNLAHIATDYLEGETPFLMRLEIKMHLMMCSDCRRYLKQLPQAIKLVSQKQKSQEMPKKMKEALINAFKHDDSPE